MSDLHVVLLAAGKGTRMKSEYPKVLHRVAGATMLEHVLDTAAQLAPSSITIVVGHGAAAVTAAVSHRPGLAFVVQEPQLGTAHALLTAEPELRSATGTLLLLSGDVPLLSRGTLHTLIVQHQAVQAAMTVLTAIVPNPHGYGRIVRSGEQIARIVEERDADPQERAIREINSGIYAFSLDTLFDPLKRIAAENQQREYYLTDLVALNRGEGRYVATVVTPNPEEVRGINSRMELAEASRIVRDAKNRELMAAGVTLEDPAITYVDRTVEVGADTIIHPGVSLEGQTTIGAGAEIHSGVRIVNSRIGDRVVVYNCSVLTDVTVDDDARVGPFAHLRNHAHLGPHAKVGNFVEVKKSRLGEGTKSMHLAYLGDAQIGAHVNIGAGTITCNYDGTSKHETTIESGAFIGSDSQLIAPVTVGEGAFVGTGTTVRENVPPGALAVSAGKQRNIEGWVEKKKEEKRITRLENLKLKTKS
jgi:bifunctional UDP-N-acetylglucosamine pyrophosphorylase/glucosamine-1-phosphate N-acetyltransferase